jgi:hypothetical protein
MHATEGEDMKICIKCNEHKEETDYQPTRSGQSMSTVCSECVRSVKRTEAVVYRATYKAKVKAAHAVYRAANPDVHKAAKKRYYEANPAEATAERRRRKQRSIEELRNGYVLRLLYRTGLANTAVPNALVELKREQLLNKRLQKQLKTLLEKTHG